MGARLECTHLTKNIGSFTLSDIHFSACSGEITGIIGVNGSGKTTLIRTLIGTYRLREQDHGQIGLFHTDGEGREALLAQPDGGAGSREYKGRVCCVLTATPYPLWMKCMEIGELCGGYYPDFDLSLYREKLAEYGLDPDGQLMEMSAGERMKQQLAFAMARDAEVYILDEPAGNLDVDFREVLYQEMRRLAYDCGRAVLYATHLVQELEGLADRILWLDRQVLKEGDSQGTNTQKDGMSRRRRKAWANRKGGMAADKFMEEDKARRERQEARHIGIQKFWGSIDELRDAYRIVEGSGRELAKIPADMLVAKRIRDTHSEAFVRMGNGKLPEGLQAEVRMAGLQEIMYYSCGGADGTVQQEQAR